MWWILKPNPEVGYLKELQGSVVCDGGTEKSCLFEVSNDLCLRWAHNEHILGVIWREVLGEV